MSIYLLRHGESTDNVDDITTGQRDVPLTKKGLEQAAKAAKDAPEFNMIVSSDLKRAIQTAEGFAKASGFDPDRIRLDERLRERNYGALEGTKKSELAYDHLSDDVEGIEALADMTGRVREVFEEHKDAKENILLVTHNGPVRFIHAIIEGVKPEDIDQSRQFPRAKLIKLDTKAALPTHKELEEYMLAKPGTRLDYPFGEEVAVYKVMDKMFSLMPEGKDPVSISLKCEPNLAETLRERYDEVMPGYHLNKRHWNTIVCSGQLNAQEILDLVDHSYNLVVESLPKSEQGKLKGREE